METIWNNSTTTPASYSTVNDTTIPNIVRLVEDPDIPKEIEFDEISLEYRGVDRVQGADLEHTQILGSQYPIIRINNTVFNYNNIVRMVVSSVEFIPTIELTVVVTGDDFQDKDFPKDGDIISVFMRTNTDTLNYLRNDFIITDCDFRNNKRSAVNKLSFFGRMYIPGIESNYNVFGVIGTSKKVCKELCKRFGIGFAYNDEEETDDFQNWICSGPPEKFIQDVVMHSWKDNTSFFKSWIDLYYNLCFVNVNKFLLSSGEEEIDITFASRTDLYQASLNDMPGEKPEDARLALKVFSNRRAFKNSPFYVYRWEVTNNSGISLSAGYSEESYTFIRNQNLYSSSDKHDDCFSTLSNLPAYDADKLDTHMILRGRTTYMDGNGEKMARVNRNVQDKYIKKTWTGIEYTMDDNVNPNDKTNNKWTGNVNKNYKRAPSHNAINLKELDKLYVTLHVDGLCLQVMRGEKVPVLIEHDAGSASTFVPGKENSDSNINRMYSGFYIVDSIEYVYTGKDVGNDKTSPFSTILVLKRREWPTPEEIEIDE